jgi:hypothetical protein
MDLSALDTSSRSNEGIELALRHPATGRELDVLFRLLGQDSARYRELEQKQAEARARQFERTGKLRMDTAELEAELLEMTVACTLGWENLVLDGVEMPYSAENARMLYRRFPWIYNQVLTAIRDRSLFLPS